MAPTAADRLRLLAGRLLAAQPPVFLGAFEAVFGLAFFACAFHGLHRVLVVLRRRGLFFPGHEHLPDSSLLDIACKTVSALFALLSCSVGTAVFLHCSPDNVLYERHPPLRHYMYFGFSYFVYDLYAMFRVFCQLQLEERSKAAKKEQEEEEHKQYLALVTDFVKNKPMLVLHHTLLPLLGVPIFFYFRPTDGDCLLSITFLMEASTPFVSLRVIFAHLGLKSSPIYIVNGLLMLVVFFFCRILIFPYLYYLYSNQLGISVASTVASVPCICTMSILLLLLPQVYWFTLMLKGSAKLVNKMILSSDTKSKPTMSTPTSSTEKEKKN